MRAEPVDRPARHRIRTDTASTLFVEAGAGSGKTTSLVSRVLTLIVADRVPIDRIAAVTFTEKAGAELRDRLRSRLEALHSETSETADHELLEQAIEGIDGAAFGTLHSFAQRTLAMFPMQAKLPPLLEVLDEVGSSVAFDTRWSEMRRAMLDDPTMSDALLLALGAGITWENLRSLARAFGSDWDLIDERISGLPAPTLRLPDTDALIRQTVELVERDADCRDHADNLALRIGVARTWLARFRAATGDAERFRMLGEVPTFGRIGRTDNWPDIDAVRAAADAWKIEVGRIRAEFADATLRPIAHWLATAVRAEADLRRADGRLVFHDLLVLARDLVRHDASVRAQLQQSFSRILLDEFQDTDPIQIELAVRIAAGADGGAPRWEDVDVPPGSLFIVGDPKQSIYRFRRASIETYLRVRNVLGGELALTANFRSVAPVLDWVNAVFSRVILPVEDAQPEYRALDPYVDGAGDGPAVSVIGAEEHDREIDAAGVRKREAADVAGAILTAQRESWTVRDLRSGEWRPASLGDIVVLVPARTSLPFLEDALLAAGIPYRAESSSLVYQSAEIRDLMAAVRAIADPSDNFALVTALRSRLFGCGDDDLFTFRRDVGGFSLFTEIPDEHATHPVARGITALGALHRSARELGPAEVLDRLIVDRRMIEIALAGGRPRDEWRRLRFVVDQARAWSDLQHGGLREYLAWAERQADDGSRVAESVLPESDLDIVRIMTVHAAKGLEFPIVILSGTSSLPQNSRGVRVLWSADGYEVSISSRLQTNDFEVLQPIDEQMDEYERRRLLYVAATRTRDHLVVSLHRKPRGAGRPTAAWILVEAGAADVDGVRALEAVHGSATVAAIAAPEPVIPFEQWSASVRLARDRSAVVASTSASGLEGTDPQVVLAAPAEAEESAGSAKGGRDLEAPPWAKGRYGSRIGRATHAVLQAVDLRDPRHLDELVSAQSLAEGVVEFSDAIGRLVSSALSSEPVRSAAALEHWREVYVAAADGDAVLEGFVDLIYRKADGTLVVVDYKTDSVPEAALGVRTAYYAPQLRAYGRMLRAATGADVELMLCFLDHTGESARVRVVPADEPA